MAKNVQVFLHNENEAESLKSNLTKYNIQDVFIDELEEQSGVNSEFVIPLPPTANPGSMAHGGAGAGQMQSNAGAVYQDLDEEDARERRTSLTFTVDESDYEDVLVEINKANGVVDKKVFD